MRVVARVLRMVGTVEVVGAWEGEWGRREVDKVVEREEGGGRLRAARRVATARECGEGTGV